MNEYDKELLKNSPSMIKGIAVQVEHLNGNSNASLALNDYIGMMSFGMALGCQICEADNTNTGKVIAEAVIGGVLFGSLVGLLAANMANRISERQRQSELSCSIEFEKTKAMIEELNHLYFPHQGLHRLLVS